jgi:hypothetical protein
MRRPLLLSRDEALAGLALVVLATLACLSPVHNDTWWHLAYGRNMAEAGGFAQTDPFSFTAAGQPFPNHQWLSERVFYAVYSIGGLPLLTGFCAALLTAAWALAWRLTRGPLTDRLLVTGVCVAASTLVWSIRPQVFTVVLLPLVLTLLLRGRLRWIPPIVLLWANLHGGVLLGLLAIGVWTALAARHERARVAPLLACMSASVAATLVTPLGLRFWPEIARSLLRSQANRLQEWAPPAWPPQHLFFWGSAMLLIVLAVRHWRRLTDPGDRGLVATALLFLVSATRSLRNVAPFMMLAAPALTRLLYRSTPVLPPTRSVRNGLLVVAASLSGLAVVASAWYAPWARLGWRPLPPEVVSAIQACEGPLLNTYADGGPIIWFVPGRRVLVDSRQDQYPTALIQAVTAAEQGGPPAALVEQHGLRCAALQAASPIVEALVSDGWATTYHDGTWVVLARPDLKSGPTYRPD